MNDDIIKVSVLVGECLHCSKTFTFVKKDIVDGYIDCSYCLTSLIVEIDDG